MALGPLNIWTRRKKEVLRDRLGWRSLSRFFAGAVSVDAKTSPGLIILQTGKGEADLHFQAKANALYVVTVFTREGAPLDYTLTTVGVVSKGAIQAAG